MNSSGGTAYTFTVSGDATNLATGVGVPAGTTITVGPLSCAVMYIPNAA